MPTPEEAERIRKILDAERVPDIEEAMAKRESTAKKSELELFKQRLKALTDELERRSPRQNPPGS